MNTIFELYKDTKNHYYKLLNYYEQQEDSKDSITALSYILINTGINVMSFVMDALEDDDEFCYRCLYRKMNLTRKAITRYLTIENENLGEIGAILVELREKLNMWCKFVNTTYNIKNEGDASEHKLVRNPYFAEIQEDMANEEEEEEDDDDDDGLLPSHSLN